MYVLPVSFSEVLPSRTKKHFREGSIKLVPKPKPLVPLSEEEVSEVATFKPDKAG